jgi:hypothetical protein
MNEEKYSSHRGGPIQIKMPFFDTPLFPMKGIIQHMTHDPNT